MARLTWMAQQEALTNEALTVRVQTLPFADDGTLLWDIFFPRRDADSVKVRTLTTTDYRPVSDRREWNQRGRLVDDRTPPTEEWEMVPIESYFKIAEREIQHLDERTLGNEALFQEIVSVQIPDRVDHLARSNFRRIEKDAFDAWALNTITAMNPQTGTTEVLSLNFAAARYETVAVAWDGAANAWDEFLLWLQRAVDLVGPIEGVIIRLTDLNLIRAEAPHFFAPDSTLQMSRTQLTEQVQQELGTAFEFVIVENTLDLYDDAGVATTRTKLWPAQTIAVIPAGTAVGSTYFAPVSRAMDIARNAGGGTPIDIRGQTVYQEVAGGGRDLTVEVQVNALPLPNEELTAVIDISGP
jgi:hypothetical protein